MSYSATVLADSPAAYWKLDETSGTTANDSSGNAKNGTYSGTLTLNQTPVITTGTSVLFSDGRVTLPTDILGIATATSPYTMEAWINTTFASTSPFIGGRAVANGNAIANMGTLNTGEMFIQVRDNNNAGLLTLSTPSAVNNGANHHLVATRTTAKLWTLYVDGTSVATGSDSMGTGATPLDEATLGVELRNLTAWHGLLDEVAIYYSTLSSARVLAHYNAGIAAAAASLIYADRKVARNTLLRV